MLTTTANFEQTAKSNMRHVSWQFSAAFDRQFNAATKFFQLDVSQLDGPDLLAPDDNDTIVEWDKYAYTDYSNRVVSLEWSREEEPHSSLVMAMADIVLDNHDHLFTADDFILPYRPVRIQAGFDGENIPAFVGVTDGLPKPDEKAGTVSLHCIDFLYSISNRPLNQSVIYQDMRTDEIIEDLLVSQVGLTAGQYSLDTGINRINFVYFEKGQKLGDALKKLMEAEQGRLFMSELGIITFKNRAHYDDAPVWYFDRSSIIDASQPSEDDIVNVVEITSKVRTVQEKGSIFTLTEAILINPGQTVDVWANFNDPVVSCDDPVPLSGSTTSYYQAFTNQDGSGTEVTSNLLLGITYLFATSFKMTFNNTGGLAAWLTKIELFGEPATNIAPLFVREVDQASIDKYDERVLSIDNEFFTDENSMSSMAQIILDDYSEYGDIFDSNVKGNMALQVGDTIGAAIRERTTVSGGVLTNHGISAFDYKITKIENKLIGGGFAQRLKLKRFTRRNFFQLDVSRLDDANVVLAP